MRVCIIFLKMDSAMALPTLNPLLEKDSVRFMFVFSFFVSFSFLLFLLLFLLF